MDDFDLEQFLVFSVLVANKPAKRMWGLAQKLTFYPAWETPLGAIRHLIANDDLEKKLRELKTGQYRRLAQCLTAISKAELDLRKCAVKDLEAIHGIGPKTARFFILKTRPDAKHAVLDTHILKWMRSRSIDVPRSTPSGKKYAEIEQLFLRECEKEGQSPAEMDKAIWEHYALGQRGLFSESETDG